MKFVQLIAGNQIAPAIETVRLAVETATNLYREFSKVEAAGRYHLMYEYSGNTVFLGNGAAPTIEIPTTSHQVGDIDDILARLSLAQLSIVRLVSADDAQVDQGCPMNPPTVSIRLDPSSGSR